jgi:hypothetical protein
MKFTNRLYNAFINKIKIFMKNKQTKWKKYYLDRYGVYHNADNLGRTEILEILFKVFKNFGYKGSDLNEETYIVMAIRQLPWGWLDADLDVIEELDEIFDLSVKEITDKEYAQIKTFGELADLLIKKAKEKKLKQQEQGRQQ